MCKPFVPKYTETNTWWAVRVFKSWVVARNSQAMEQFPADLLENSYPMHVIDRTLAAFIIEARKVDGLYYPGSDQLDPARNNFR